MRTDLNPLASYGYRDILDKAGLDFFGGEFQDQMTLASTAGEGSTGRIWVAATGAPVVTLEGHDDAVTTLAYAPAGDRLVTGSRDGTVRVWSAATGESVATMAGRLEAMTSLAVAPDGANVTVVSDGDKVTVWRVATGERVAELRGRVSLRQADGASLWPIPPRLLTRVGCQRLGQFTRGYAEVAEICEPLVATARSL